ncbi:MAG: glycoside hydrolase family 2 [Lachnospiraceae bacterium]|nr:glycoside hydrolase family 2 [Lachnospiraceae bacterium]
MSKAKKYMSDIHLEDYKKQYETVKATVKDHIFTGGRKSLSLNGKWNYAVDQYDTCIRQKWFLEKSIDENGLTLPLDYSFDKWPEMELPSCWNVVDEKYLLYEGSMIFTRRFNCTPEEDEEVYLRVGAANYLIRVFLNGEYIGIHRGGSTPAFFLITEHLKEDNRLLIQADSSRRPEQVPTENTDWFNYGGIYRDIEIFKVPKIHIKDFRIALVPDDSYKNVSVEVKISESIDTTALIAIDELGIRCEFPLDKGYGSVILSCEPELWSPDTPKLYDVSLSCMSDKVSDRVGFRQISVKGRQILLNGEPLFLRGISCHEDSVKNGKALSRDERIENIRIAKELGCNFMRIAHYPHHEEMAVLADEMGIMLWEEVPVYWAIRFENPDTYLDAQNQLMELIKRDHNRASVIIWSVGNENADTDERLKFMKDLADTAHEQDRTRLVSAACLVDAEENKIADRLADHIDVIGINEYCGWYTPDFSKLPELMKNSDPEKPVIITEFGADALLGFHGSEKDKGTEECQKYVYEKQIEVLGDIEYIKGMTPWILYDFRCPRRTSSIQNYYNRKGLLSEDKKSKKPAFYVLQKFYLEKERAGKKQ